MKDLALHTSALLVHWEDKTSCIYAFEAKIVSPTVIHIDIDV